MSELDKAVQAMTNAEQPAAEAPPVEPVKEAPKQEESAAKKFAALAKKEKQLRRQQEELKAQEHKNQELMKRLEALESTIQGINQIKDSGNPMEALKYFGHDYNKATEFALNGEKPTPEQLVKSIEERVNKRIETLEEKQNREKQEYAKKLEADATEAINNFKTEIGQFLEAKHDEYELIHHYQAKEHLFQVIEQHFLATKKVLGIKEAADLVEKELEEQTAKALATKKLSSKLQTKTQDSDPSGKTQNEPRGLNNSITSSTPSLLSAKTENDRIARALAALAQQ